jgi:hypothetical protein
MSTNINLAYAGHFTRVLHDTVISIDSSDGSITPYGEKILQEYLPPGLRFATLRDRFRYVELPILKDWSVRFYRTDVWKKIGEGTGISEDIFTFLGNETYCDQLRRLWDINEAEDVTGVKCPYHNRFDETLDNYVFQRWGRRISVNHVMHYVHTGEVPYGAKIDLSHLCHEHMCSHEPRNEPGGIDTAIEGHGYNIDRNNCGAIEWQKLRGTA